MMTKEEVAQVIAYCDENKISYKQRLAELGINPWNFYDAKRKYAPKQEGESSGEFLQLVPGGSSLPNPIKPSRPRSYKQKDSAHGAVAVCIESQDASRYDDGTFSQETLLIHPMIYDHIKNISLYKGLTPAIDLALDYIATVTADVEIGTHLLDLGVKAVVSEYTTSLVNAKGYEAHRRYIDIQLALKGEELIRCKPLPQVTETIPYDEAKDAARYADCPGIDMVIGDGYFLLVFPEDAHEPGLAPGGVCAPVKKVVMKVPVPSTEKQ